MYVAAPRDSTNAHTLPCRRRRVKRTAHKYPANRTAGRLTGLFSPCISGHSRGPGECISMTSPTIDLPDGATSSPAARPHRLNGAVALCGTRQPLKIEETDDGCYRGIVPSWARPGEIIWLQIVRDGGEVEYPCRVVGCQRDSAGAGGKRPNYVWTLKPLGEPYPV